MWKKDDGPDPVPPPRPEPIPTYERPAPPKPAGERATIGRSITINGQVSGDEDLLIQGRVEGSVNLKQHSVTVGPEGEIKANIAGRVITVEGRVEGDLIAQEQIILRGSAIVQGNIAAPRVVLEDGARFRGGVDMGETAKPGGRGAERAGAAEPGRAAPASVRTAAAEPDAGGKPGDVKGAAGGVKDVASAVATQAR